MTARSRRPPGRGRGVAGPASMRVRFIRVDQEEWQALDAGYDGAPVGAVAVLLGRGPGAAAGIPAVSAGIDEADGGFGVVRVSASSEDLDADAAGTLHLDLLVGPPLCDDFARRLYRDVLTAALRALAEEWPGGLIRLTWQRGDDVAALAVLALAQPAGGGAAS